MSRKDRQAPPQKPFAGDTAERLAAIVEAAERAAVTVIDDAEKQAQRQLEQAREEADRLVAERLGALSQLTDSLIAQAESIQAQSQQLLAALAEAKRQVAGEGGEVPAAAVGAPTPIRGSHLSAVEPATEPSPAIDTRFAAESRGIDEDPGSPAGARLLATQMAVAGNSREEIEERLRNEFGIEDTVPILDAILGAEE